MIDVDHQVGRIAIELVTLHIELPRPRQRIRGLQQHEAFAIDRVPSGTNLFRVRVKGIDPLTFQKRLAATGVMLSAPQRDTFLVGVNETINRTTASDLSGAFVRAAAV